MRWFFPFLGFAAFAADLLGEVFWGKFSGEKEKGKDVGGGRTTTRRARRRKERKGNLNEIVVIMEFKKCIMIYELKVLKKK